MYSHHFVDCSKCMFVFIAFLNISGFQKRGVVIINNKTSGGGGGVSVAYNCKGEKKSEFGQKGGLQPPPPLYLLLHLI